MKRLGEDFFMRPTLEVARDLLGKLLIRKVGNQILIGEINEVEAYIGQDDPACHAAAGKTKRNEVMFRKGGHSYVYFTYGMYHCLNIVTENEHFPAAVLIRSIKPIKGYRQMLANRSRKNSKTKLNPLNIANGPGKLCVALDIDLGLNGEDVAMSRNLWIADAGTNIAKFTEAPRIGISQGKELLWRFYY